MTDRAETIAKVCAALTAHERDEASAIAGSEYPFVPIPPSRRSYTPYQCMAVFLRDGFIDRYSGDRLVCPGALRTLSVVMPEEFPAHPNWHMAKSHLVYWELFPTIDHLVPVARGGADSEDNWITTSMLKNQAKGHWTLDELG